MKGGCISRGRTCPLAKADALAFLLEAFQKAQDIHNPHFAGVLREVAKNAKSLLWNASGLTRLVEPAAVEAGCD